MNENLIKDNEHIKINNYIRFFKDMFYEYKDKNTDTIHISDTAFLILYEEYNKIKQINSNLCYSNINKRINLENILQNSNYKVNGDPVKIIKYVMNTENEENIFDEIILKFRNETYKLIDISSNDIPHYFFNIKIAEETHIKEQLIKEYEFILNNSIQMKTMYNYAKDFIYNWDNNEYNINVRSLFNNLKTHMLETVNSLKTHNIEKIIEQISLYNLLYNEGVAYINRKIGKNLLNENMFLLLLKKHCSNKEIISGINYIDNNPAIKSIIEEKYNVK